MMKRVHREPSKATKERRARYLCRAADTSGCRRAHSFMQLLCAAVLVHYMSRSMCRRSISHHDTPAVMNMVRNANWCLQTQNDVLSDQVNLCDRDTLFLYVRTI